MLTRGTEAGVILIGRVDQLPPERSVSAICRLLDAKQWHPEMPELLVPMRFVFVLFTSATNYQSSLELDNVGKCLGSMMVDEVASRCNEI